MASRMDISAQKPAVFAASGGDSFHHRPHEGFDPAVIPQALAVNEHLASFLAFRVIDNHCGVKGVDQVWKGLGIVIDHVLLAPFGGRT